MSNVKQIISNNLKDFFFSGFNSNFDHNISQIIQKFVEESKELIIKLLDDTRENIVNSSNFDELMNFTTLGFSEMQKYVGLKYDNFVLQPIDESINNIEMKTDILIPGSDKIVNIYKLDGCMRVQKSTNNLLFSILKLYKSFNVVNEDNYDLRNKILDVFGYDQPDSMIVPMSYCIPMNYRYDNSDSESFIKNNNMSNMHTEQTYKPGFINVYTHIDKDDFYRMLLNTLFLESKYSFDSKMIDLTNFKNLYRSILQILLMQLNKIDIVSKLITSNYIEKLVKIAIAKSTFGSISKYYDNMTTYGVRGYVINKFKQVVKNRKTSETWGNRGYSSKNPVDIIFGSRGMDHIFNFVIDELMNKKLFDATGSRTETIFEFIISNSISYIIASGSLCVGESSSIKSMDNLMGELNDEYDLVFPYIEEISKGYYESNNDLITSLISVSYGTFILKHIYDTKHRIKNNSFFTMKEFNYVTGLLENTIDMINNNLYKISKITEKFMPVGFFMEEDNCPEICCQKDPTRKTDPDNLENILNPGKMFDHLQNVLCRLITMPTLMRIFKNIRAIDRHVWDIRDKALRNPVMDDSNISSKENDEWVYKNLFSKSTENLIERFVGIGNTSIGGNVENFCNRLKKDTIIGIESNDNEIINNVIRKSIKLYDVINYKNASQEDVNLMNETLLFVANKISSTDE